MKFLFPFLLSVFLLNCTNNVKENSSTNHSKDSVKTDTVNKNNTILKPKKTRTRNKYPTWLNTINQTKNDTNKVYGNHSIHKLEIINDSLSTVIFEFNTGVCSSYTLETFLNRKIINTLEIEKRCDHDLANPEYYWTEYKFTSLREIKVTSYKEYLHDTLINSNGSIKNGYDFMELESIKDSVSNYYKIQNNGTIKKTL